MDRRQEILLAATKSFTLFGYKATTIEQVAKICIEAIKNGIKEPTAAEQYRRNQKVQLSPTEEVGKEAGATLSFATAKLFVLGK